MFTAVCDVVLLSYLSLSEVDFYRERERERERKIVEEEEENGIFILQKF